jgi:hypothetical protein
VTETSSDPAAGLIQTITPTVPRPVDELHVAAVLESTGVTDGAALGTYRQDNVFVLADAVYQRLSASAGPAGDDQPTAGEKAPGTVRLLAHGLLYVLPSTLYPAVLAALGSAAMIRGMVFATTLGWVWGMGMSAVAYQLAGQGKDRSAGRALRLLGPAGLVAGLGAAVLLAVTGPGGAGMVAFVVAQMGFQLMSGVLVYYGHELRIAVTMLPATVMGIVFLASHSARTLTGPALAAGGFSVLLLAVTAWISSKRAPARSESASRTTAQSLLAGVAPSVGYALLCAAFLLVTDSQFFLREIDLAIAALPLILGMGALEWRAHRFTAKVAKLWDRVRVCEEFGRHAWWLLLGELGTCLTVLTALGAVLVILLRDDGALSARGAMLIDAHVLLGGVFFLGFILTRYQQSGRLLIIMAAAVAADLILLPWAGGRWAPDGAVPIFLFCAATTLVAQLVALRISFRRAYLYR